MAMVVETDHVAIIGGMGVLVTLVVVLLICVKKKGRASTTPNIPNTEAAPPSYIGNASYGNTATSPSIPRPRANLPNQNKGVVEYATSDPVNNSGEVVYDATPAQVRDENERKQLETQPVYAVSTKVDKKKNPKQPVYAVVKPKRHTQFEKDDGAPKIDSKNNHDDVNDDYASIDEVIANNPDNDIDLSNYGDLVDAVGYASIKHNSNLHTEYASSNQLATITSNPDYATVEDVNTDTYATPTKRPTLRKSANASDKTTPPVPTSSAAKARLVLNLSTGESEFMSPLDAEPRPVSRYAIAKEVPTTVPSQVAYATSIPVRAPQPTGPPPADAYSVPNRINTKQKSIAVKSRSTSSSSNRSMDGVQRSVYKTKHEGANIDDDEDDTDDDAENTYEDPQDITHFYDVSREAAEKLVIKAGVDGAFLVRPSSSSSSGYVLCYIKTGRVKQVLIDQGGTKVKVCTSRTWYPSINKLCEAYSKPNNDKVLGLLLRPMPESTIAAVVMGDSPGPVTAVTAVVAAAVKDDESVAVDGNASIDDSDFLWGGNDYTTPEDIDTALQENRQYTQHQESNEDAEC
eukprot:m.79328 g.79328  ORF g.79328 m.79328 type:complete len:574 (+) comp25203_c1_seq1:193-1914(+)